MEKRLDSRWWSQEEINLLLSLYGSKSIEEISKLLNKSVGSLYYILHKKNINTNISFWTDEELSYLKENYPSKSARELRDHLKHSPDVIQQKAISLGYKRKLLHWTEEEDRDLIGMKEEGLTNETISEILNFDKTSVHYRLLELGLTGKIRRWTKEELEIIELMALSGKFSYIDIAEKVKATYEQIANTCCRNKWNKFVKRVISKGEEFLLKFLKELYPNSEIWPQFHIGERLRLDFFIPHLNLGIEFDGEQHFKKVSAFQTTDENFLYQKEKDERKNSLCSEYKISLLRIKYNEPLTLDYLKNKIEQLEQSSGSPELEIAKKNKGFCSNATLLRKENNELYKARFKEKRKEFLNSEKYQNFLKNNKEYKKKYLLEFKKKKLAKIVETEKDNILETEVSHE